MKPVTYHNARALLLSVATAALLTTSAYADCTYELFNISSVKGTTVGEFIDQISDECGMSVIVADTQAEEILKKQMHKTFLKNLTVNEVLDLIIKENDLQYTLVNNVLKISYLTTKTYHIDYIGTERKGTGSTNVRLSSDVGSGGAMGRPGAMGGGAMGGTNTNGAGGMGSNQTGGTSSVSGTNISSVDEVKFWANLEAEVKSIVSRPEDIYRKKEGVESSDANTTDDIHSVYINKSAGMLTVTGTGKQIERLNKYVDELQKRMQTQVMIDVKMYSVVFEDGSSTGVDWTQLYALQNVDLSFNAFNKHNISGFTADSATGSNILAPLSEVTFGTTAIKDASIFQLGTKGSLKEVIKFLKTQGDVYSLSNPKILTLNNQPALITSGTELFYKTQSSSAAASTGGPAVGGTTDVVSSVFAGVLLDITPEIANDGSITLRINPSVSDIASQLATDNSTRSMPPDLSRRQMSSVVTVKDGSTIIMGGLINTKNDLTGNKLPILGDIPLLGWLFKNEKMTKKTEEIVIVIEPHIVKRDGSNVSLSDLGYTRMNSSIQKSEIERSSILKEADEDIKKLRQLQEDAK